MTDKEKIIEHINKIEQYSRKPGNEWLLDELKNRFGSIDKIDEVYEYCIERVIKEQAELFYKDFPITTIVPGLTEDFVKMEFCHRRNDFEEFSMAVYQQIERITTEVCLNKKLIDVVSKLMGHPAYVKSVQLIDGTWSTPTISDRSSSSSYQIAKLLFGKKALEKSMNSLPAHWAVDKIYCILYFLCYQAKLTSHDYNQFNEYKNIYYSIYQFRNLNHRGSSQNDDQKEVIDGIRPQIGVYYFKFMQALLFYVEGVAKGLSKIDELYNYAESQEKKTVLSFNVVGKIELSEKDSKRYK